MKKKFIKNLVLLVSMSFFAIESMAFSGSAEVDGIWYNIVTKGQTAEVRQSPTGYTGDIVIPATIEYEGVTCNVISIGQNAFKNATGMTSVQIPVSITSISRGAFEGCKGLTSIVIPSSITSIGEDAFKNCTNLLDFHIPDIETWCNIDFYVSTFNCEHHLFLNDIIIENLIIPDGVKRIPDNAFSYCMDIKSIFIPASVEQIDYSAFSNCYQLSSLTLSEGVKVIDDRAFAYNQSLKELKLPSTLSQIGAYAFGSCKELTDVYCYAVKLPTTSGVIAKDQFNDCDIEYATLHVPSESLENYSSTKPWSSFGTKVALSESGSLEKCATPTIRYEEGKLLFHCDTEGAEIHYSFENVGLKNGVGTEVIITTTYTVSAYATKVGYDNSDVATQSLIGFNRKGDTNGDGVVNAADVVETVNIIMGSE